MSLILMRRYIQNVHTRVRFSLVTEYSRSVSWCESRWDLGAPSQGSLAGQGHEPSRDACLGSWLALGWSDYFTLRILFLFCSEQVHV